MKEQPIATENAIAILLIGNEILTADVGEKNLSYMISRLGARGYPTGEVRIVGDAVYSIAEACRQLSTHWRYVFTSGGIGPTHDDVTMAGVAKAFRQALCHNQEMHHFLMKRHGGRTLSIMERLAMLPEGIELYEDGDHWPLFRVDNCYILPGLPNALRTKIDRVTELLPAIQAPRKQTIYTDVDEISLAQWLSGLQKRHNQVAIGSYIPTDKADWKTKLTLISIDEQALQQTTTELYQHLTKLKGSPRLE